MARKTEPSIITAGQKLKPANEAAYGTAADSTNAEPKKTYRTRQKAGDVSEIPDRLPIITNPIYQNALTFCKNDTAYLQPLSNTSDLKYRDGILYHKGLPATLANLKPGTNIEKINLPLLMALYGIILTKVSDTLSENQSTNEVTTIYYPDYAKKIGKSAGIKETDVQECVSDIKQFENLIGIIDNGTKGGDILPVIDSFDYDALKNTISFSSPYMLRIINDIYRASIRKNKKGDAVLTKNGKPHMLPAYSYLVDMSIVKEKNKKAVGIVFIVVTLIEQAGKHTPHIQARTIVERNPLLHKSLEKSTTGNKDVLLKRAFQKAWKLLRDKTYLTEVYENIQLPNPEDKLSIPTVSKIAMVFKFPHDGKDTKS